MSKEIIITIQTQTDDLVNFLSSDVIERSVAPIGSEKTFVNLIKNGHNYVLGIYKNKKGAQDAIDGIRGAIQNQFRTFIME